MSVTARSCHGIAKPVRPAAPRRPIERSAALRQDVPGSDGWRNDPATFAEQLRADPQFDPATYLIAVDRSGAYAGLVRIWIRTAGPRLGLVAVRPAYRRQGLAMALLAGSPAGRVGRAGRPAQRPAGSRAGGTAGNPSMLFGFFFAQ